MVLLKGEVSRENLGFKKEAYKRNLWCLLGP